MLADSGFLLDDLRTQRALLEFTSAQALRFQSRSVLGCHQHPDHANRAEDEPSDKPLVLATIVVMAAKTIDHTNKEVISICALRLPSKPATAWQLSRQT